MCVCEFVPAHRTVVRCGLLWLFATVAVQCPCTSTGFYSIFLLPVFFNGLQWNFVITQTLNKLGTPHRLNIEWIEDFCFESSQWMKSIGMAFCMMDEGVWKYFAVFCRVFIFLWLSAEFFLLISPIGWWWSWNKNQDFNKIRRHNKIWHARIGILIEIVLPIKVCLLKSSNEILKNYVFLMEIETYTFSVHLLICFNLW